MPLIQSKSKKAMSKNIETEMEHGKPQKQSIAIAYEVKRKNSRKKMASGGAVNESAASEHRPAPSEKDKDSKEVSHNSGKKSSHDDSWTDRPTEAQAKRPSLVPLSQPKMAGSDAFSVRSRAEADADLHRLSSMPPESDKAQPSHMLNEEGANRQGPKVHPLKMMAQGGIAMEMGKGPEEDRVKHPAGLESDNDEMAPMSKEYMSGYMDAQAHMANGGKVKPANHIDREDKGYGAIMHKAEGGEIDLDEVAEDKHASIAAAIMAKHQKMAEGGQVDIEENGEEQPNAYDGHNREILKENYDEDMEDVSQPEDSNEHSDEIDSDKHDMISSIRSKMKRKQMR